MAAALAAATPAAAENPDQPLSGPTASTESHSPTESVQLIVRHDSDGGAPVFDTISTSLSGIMTIANRADVTGLEIDGKASLMWVPSDPDYQLQWENRTTGVENAWDITRGDPSTVIAIVDSGVNPGPEFGSRLLAGMSFTGNNPLVDDLGHGTSVAGVAAAEANNDVAGAGICPVCKILPVQVATADGSVLWSAAASGIVWAVDQGADILNLSFGADASSSVLSDAVNYATTRGVVVVASAGNSGNDNPVYPAAMPGVISAAGHDEAGNRYSWSTYGQLVDVAAPGCVFSIEGGSPATVCGTSFASPWVAGLAALLMARDASMTPDQVQSALEASTVANDWVRTGRVDASRLIQPYPPSLDPLQPRINPGDVALTGEYSGAVSQVELMVDGSLAAVDPSPTDGRFQLMWDASTVEPGTHELLVDAIDQLGRTLASGPVSVEVNLISGFGDVNPLAYYESAVTWMVDNAITGGTSPTTFEPDTPVTRAQLATFLWRFSGTPSSTSAGSLTDVAANSWYAQAVNWMVETGITTGTTPTTFEPDRQVSRAQAATFLWRLAGTPTGAPSSNFTDTGGGIWYSNAVDWMVDHGITTGTTPTTFEPEAGLTRAQLATFLWRYAGCPAA